MASGGGDYHRGTSQPASYALSELGRRMSNMLRVGIVEEIDYNKAKARVRFGEILSNWLPWTTVKAANDVAWNPPEEGEQVLVAFLSGNRASGVILASLYKTDFPANGDSSLPMKRLTYADGSVKQFDTENSSDQQVLNNAGEFIRDVSDAREEMREGQHLVNVGGATVEVTPSAITLTIGSSVITMVDGSISIVADQINITGPITHDGGDITTTNQITSDVEVQAQAIKLTTHKHVHGDPITGGPVP